MLYSWALTSSQHYHYGIEKKSHVCRRLASYNLPNIHKEKLLAIELSNFKIKFCAAKKIHLDTNKEFNVVL